MSKGNTNSKFRQLLIKRRQKQRTEAQNRYYLFLVHKFLGTKQLCSPDRNNDIKDTKSPVQSQHHLSSVNLQPKQSLASLKSSRNYASHVTPPPKLPNLTKITSSGDIEITSRTPAYNEGFKIYKSSQRNDSIRRITRVPSEPNENLQRRISAPGSPRKLPVIPMNWRVGPNERKRVTNIGIRNVLQRRIRVAQSMDGNQLYGM